MNFIHTQPADRYQRQFGLLTRFGLQSNVIRVASYTNVEAEGAVLSKAVVYPALRKVVQEYPELGMISFYGQSKKKKAQHRSFSGILSHINLDDHVEFLEIPTEEGKAGLTTTIERYHGVWFDSSKKPPWRLVVVNGKHAIFVFDHFITDGRGSTFIFESLLEALNSPNQCHNGSSIIELTTEVKGFPEVDPVKRYGTGPSILFAIMSYIRFWCIQFFYRGTDLFFNDARYQQRDLAFGEPKKEDNLVVTKIDTLCLEADTMSKCLQACREHQTSFTSLLHTLIKVSLSADFYPKAKFSHSVTGIDVRPYLLNQDRDKTISTAVSIISSFDWLHTFHQAGQSTGSIDPVPVNSDLLWELARKHRAHVVNDLNHKRSWMKAWLSIDLIGDDEEEYISQLLPGLKIVQKNSFAVSNLGAFDNRSARPWIISNMEFSAGAVKAGYGPNLVFNVAGVRDAATVIHVSSEEGSLSNDFVALLLGSIEKRILAVI
ncbi:Alcohol acetyltransferase [Penicillium concentricum]|uniref:Alcohol acetyltransferase n=1 Tax=Penicillium concentricum TaxID=293559 RepID=A0A9W9UTK2_9EURO|nr:Alcohol acetyltransferase [Penicillium concentricum]KAJ5357008.1 Alcohol acetyltransferase [Penicillium concentricum]